MLASMHALPVQVVTHCTFDPTASVSAYVQCPRPATADEIKKHESDGSDQGAGRMCRPRATSPRVHADLSRALAAAVLFNEPATPVPAGNKPAADIKSRRWICSAGLDACSVTSRCQNLLRAA